MPKFSSDIAEAVRVNLKDLLRFDTMGGKIIWVKKTSATGYHEFKKQHPDYEDGTLAVYNTITAGMAAVNDYDTLIITPGNYDEAGTITLTSKKGVKIIGSNSGMQWGEGGTCWRDVTSTLDLFNIVGCQALEISGITFINITSGKDAINMASVITYSTHIHHCCFIGNVGGSDVQGYAINAGGSLSADLYVHDCKFFKQLTGAIIAIGQRATIVNNLFIVGAAGAGVDGCDAGSAFNVIADNYFVGAVSTGYGIKRESYTASNLAIINNRFIGFSAGYAINQVASSDSTVVGNIEDGADGASADIDPTAS